MLNTCKLQLARYFFLLGRGGRMGFDRCQSLYSDFEYEVSILIPARDC
jgi:hypothetical protein